MEFDFVILDETESTNSAALKLAKSTDKPTLIVAKKQTNGRGRIDRSWSDPGGNFSGSILIKIDEDKITLPLLKEKDLIKRSTKKVKIYLDTKETRKLELEGIQATKSVQKLIEESGGSIK